MQPLNKYLFSSISILGIISLFVIILLTDTPAAFETIIIIALTFLYAICIKKELQQNSLYLYIIITFIYLGSATIISQCFSETDFYLSSDPTRYIAKVHSTTSQSTVLYELFKTYINFQDNNGLYNAMLGELGIICHKYNIIPSSLFITLPQTFFGILTILTLYRIICLFYDSKKSFKYSLIFSICSLVLLYSCIIVRDIIITFIFTKGLEIILQKFKTTHLLILIILMLIACGIRLFSGFFFVLFILYYLYFALNNKFIKIIVLPIVFIILGGVGMAAFVEDMVSKTTEEVEGYAQWQADASNNDGLSSKLRKLPIGINAIALTLYSQANPFPPYSTLRNDNLSLPQMYMSILMTITAIWWYYISYSLICYFFLNSGYTKIKIKYRYLYALALLLIIVSSYMHVDIRRLIPVYPIIYLLYLIYRYKIESIKKINKISNILWAFYIGLNIIYLIIKP